MNGCDPYIYRQFGQRWHFPNYFGYYACTSGRKWYSLFVVKLALRSYIVTHIVRTRYKPDGKGGYIKVNGWLSK